MVYVHTVIMQEGDIFVWRVRRNTPKGGYMLGTSKQKDIFAETSVKG